MTEKNRLTKLLKIFLGTIEGLDQNQIDQLIAGKAKLSFVGTERAKETGAGPATDQADVLAKLNGCEDRDGARLVLSAITNREALATLARALKVHVVKHDRREDIESKIIEFVIGGKLRTEAIQSLNLKGGGNRTVDE